MAKEMYRLVEYYGNSTCRSAYFEVGSYMERQLITRFFNCGDNDIIQFALLKAHLTKNELEVITATLDECKTQEKIAEDMGYSVRRVQQFWCSGVNKLLNIPWVKAYALYL